MHSAIVLDINSGSVGAGVVLLRRRLQPALLYSNRLRFHPAESQSRRAYERALKTALDQLLRQTLHDGLITLSKNGKVPRQPDHILVSLSSIWEESNLDMIEAEIEKVFGSKRGVCPKDSLFLLAKTLNLTGGKESLVASVSGEATEITSLHHLELRRPEPVPYGPAKIARRIAQEQKIDFHLADSLLSLYSQNLLSPNKKSEIEKIVADEMEKWRQAIFDIEGAQKTKSIRLFARPEYATLASRVFKSAFPSAEIKLEKGDNLEYLAVFSNSLL